LGTFVTSKAADLSRSRTRVSSKIYGARYSPNRELQLRVIFAGAPTQLSRQIGRPVRRSRNCQRCNWFHPGMYC